MPVGRGSGCLGNMYPAPRKWTKYSRMYCRMYQHRFRLGMCTNRRRFAQRRYCRLASRTGPPSRLALSVREQSERRGQNHRIAAWLRSSLASSCGMELPPVFHLELSQLSYRHALVSEACPPRVRAAYVAATRHLVSSIAASDSNRHPHFESKR